MKKFRTWAKRPANTNFLLFMIIAMVFLAFAFYSYNTRNRTASLLDKIGLWLDDARDGVVDNVEGFGIIFGLVAHFIGRLWNSALILIQVYVPVYMAVITIIQTVFTRILHSPKSSGRILCYRISMGFCFAALLFHAIIFSYLLYKFSSVWIMVLVDILVIVIVVICSKNTYSKKIKEQYDVHKTEQDERIIENV